MLLHQPLLPLNRKPPTKALAIQNSSARATAGPLVLNSTFRVAAMAKNSTMLIR